jgi:hypothetical protein
VVFPENILPLARKKKSFVAVISFPPDQFVERDFLEVFDEGVFLLAEFITINLVLMES